MKKIIQYIEEVKQLSEKYDSLSNFIKNKADSLSQNNNQKSVIDDFRNEQVITFLVDKYDSSKVGTFEVITNDNVEMNCAVPMEDFPIEEIGNEQYLILHTDNGVMVRKISQCLSENITRKPSFFFNEGKNIPITAVEYMWLEDVNDNITFKNSLAFASTENGFHTVSNAIFAYNEGCKNDDGQWVFDYKATNDENYKNSNNDWSEYNHIRIDDFINCDTTVKERIMYLDTNTDIKEFLIECAHNVVQPCYNMQQKFNSVARQMGVSEDLLKDVTGKHSKSYVENANVM